MRRGSDIGCYESIPHDRETPKKTFDTFVHSSKLPAREADLVPVHTQVSHQADTE